jgi:glycosyltransferase involved in cell wall biosynthesis
MKSSVGPRAYRAEGLLRRSGARRAGEGGQPASSDPGIPAAPLGRPAQPQRILHVAETIKGGVGTYLANLLRLQLTHLGDSQIRALVPYEHRHQVDSVPQGILRTFPRPGRSMHSVLALARHTLNEVRDFRPDIIHAHSTFAGAVVRLLFAFSPKRPRIIYCPHGWSFERPVPLHWKVLYRLCESMLAPLCDRVIAVSAHEAGIAKSIGISPRRCRILPNGILRQSAGATPLPWPDNRLKVLYVGRLDPAKGFDVLLNAIEGFESRLTLRVAGENVVRKAETRKTASNITYLGWLSASEIEGALSMADVVVIPSRNEAFGLAALEAMRAGKMVVASAVGGIPEIVQDGVTGRLVPPEDPVALRNALLQDSPETRNLMGQHGRERFLAHFTAEHMHEEILRLYADVASRRDEAAPRTAQLTAIPR